MELTPPARPSRPTQKRFQFGLWFLFLVTTASAICCALVRTVGEMIVWPFLRYVAYGYLIGLTGYFALRFPFLIRHIVQGRRRVAAERRRLSSWAEKMRSERQATRSSHNTHEPGDSEHDR